MNNAETSRWSQVSGLSILVAGIATLGVLAIAVYSSAQPADAAGTVLVRGIVKPGGDANSINLYITHVGSAPDASAIRGIRTDVNLASAKRFKWETDSAKNLTKVRTTSIPAPEQEVVIYGTLKDDNRIAATWSVQNYRQFTIEGTLQGRTLDTNSTDKGWLTVSVTGSTLRNVLPSAKFKETQLKNKDLRIRINGQTSINALGNPKHLDEVTAGQQKVRIEGQLQDEDTWIASKVYELQN